MPYRKSGESDNEAARLAALLGIHSGTRIGAADDDYDTNTLYELKDLQEYTARKVEVDDIRVIRKMLRDEDYSLYKFEDPVVLHETCCFSLAVSDVIETDRLVAAAFFDDRPASPDLLNNAKKWKMANGLKTMNPLNTLYLRMFACNPEVAEDVCLTEVISHAFSACVHAEHIVVELPSLDYTGPFVFSPLVKEIVISPLPKQKRKIILYKKDLLMPHLIVRDGREHDLDDLTPLLPLDQATLEREFGKSNLTDLISMSDKANQTMVAEWKNEAVGIIAVSADIDYDHLNKSFHLDPFHGLYKPHPADEIYVQDDSPATVVDLEFDRLFRQAERTVKERGGIRIHRQDEAITPYPYDVELIKEIGTCHVMSDENTSSLEKDSKPRRNKSVRKVSRSAFAGTKKGRLSAEEGEDDDEEDEGEEEEMTIGAMGDVVIEKIHLDEEEGEDEMEVLEEDDEQTGHEVVQLADDDDDFVMPEDKKPPVIVEVAVIEVTTPEMEAPAGEEEEEGVLPADGGEGSPREGEKDEDFRKIGGEDGEEEGRDSEEGAPAEGEEDLEGAEVEETKGVNPELPEDDQEEGSGAVEGGGEVEGKESKKKSSERGEQLLEVGESRDIAKSHSPTKRKSDSDSPSVSDSDAAVVGPLSAVTTVVDEDDEEEEEGVVDSRRSKLEPSKLEVQGSQDKQADRPPKTTEQKLELFKKAWDVYKMMQDENLTMEQAKEMLPPADVDALEEAQLISPASIIKFVSAFLPDETRYPFQRPKALQGQSSVFHGIANALAIKLFNSGKKYAVRNNDMFADIFKSFPNREYLIVTVPVGILEPGWLDHFVRAVPKPMSNYPRELFVMHKTAFTAKLRVRKAKEKDMNPVRNFLSSLLEKDKIFHDFLESFVFPGDQPSGPRMTCYLAEVRNYEGLPIVGLAMVSADGESTKYPVNYDLDKHTYYTAHDPSSHGYVHHLIMNPIFQRSSRLFLKELMRLEGKDCFYHRIYPKSADNDTIRHQSVLNNLEDWIPVMPRRRIHYQDLNLVDTYDDERQPPKYAQDMREPYALLHVSKKFVLEPKIIVTKHLVFVGASTTTLSCLEQMLTSSCRSFKHLTVIDPYGLPGQLPKDPVRNEFFAVRNGGTRMSYQSDTEWAQRLGIHLWVRVVMGRVTKIEKKSKYVVVNQDFVVPYDKLVLAPGLQFQRLDCPEPEIHGPSFKRSTTTQQDFEEDDDQESLEFVRDTPKPKNVFMINTEVEAGIALEFLRKYQPFMQKQKVLVFGGGLPTYACVKALLEFGIPPEKIVLIGTPDREIQWEKKSGYTLSNKVRGPMKKFLEAAGVNVIENYEFSHWEVCPVSGLTKRVHFKSLTERHAHISFSTFALFCYRYKRVDDSLVCVLQEASIYYNEGIVIDGRFKTSDPNIYAAGPATAYQKCLFADHQNHVYFQSEEIGHKLAEILVEDPVTDTGGPRKLEDVLKFKRPLTRAIKLLGGWHYLYIRSPGSHSRCTDAAGSREVCECTTEVVTGSVIEEEDPQQRFFKIRLNDRSRIVSFECMSRTAFSFSNMSCLYGQHETLLNKMMERLESGETTCLFSHFRQPWFAMVCVDKWDSFTEELRDLYKSHDIGDGVRLADFIRDFIENLDNPDALDMDPNIIRSVWRNSGLKDSVENKLLNFLKFNRLALPMFAHHNYVEDLLEERSTSALYYPNTKSHMMFI